MGRKAWEQFPEEWRSSIISLFKLQDIDFEKTFITDEAQGKKDNAEDGSQLMTRKEAASYAGVSTDTIDNWRKAGCIKDRKLADGRPSRVLIDRKDLKRHLDSKVVHDPHKRVCETPMKGAQYRAR